MDVYLIYFAPYLAVGFGTMLGPFITDGWPRWLVVFVNWCAEMANGVWIAGIAMVVLLVVSVPIPLATMLSWPVMYFSGSYFSRMSDRMDERTREIKRQGWEAHRKKIDDTRKAGKQGDQP